MRVSLSPRSTEPPAWRERASGYLCARAEDGGAYGSVPTTCGTVSAHATLLRRGGTRTSHGERGDCGSDPPRGGGRRPGRAPAAEVQGRKVWAGREAQRPCAVFCGYIYYCGAAREQRVTNHRTHSAAPAAAQDGCVWFSHKIEKINPPRPRKGDINGGSCRSSWRFSACCYCWSVAPVVSAPERSASAIGKFTTHHPPPPPVRMRFGVRKRRRRQGDASVQQTLPLMQPAASRSPPPPRPIRNGGMVQQQLHSVAALACNESNPCNGNPCLLGVCLCIDGRGEAL